MVHMDFEKGLVTAVAQDVDNNDVLMVAYMNEEAFRKTVETGKVHYYSRSRGKLWLKGESSGHVQHVEEILVDCDLDTVVLKIRQKGAACHKGYRSCFYRRLETTAEKVFDPGKTYGGK